MTKTAKREIKLRCMDCGENSLLRAAELDTRPEPFAEDHVDGVYRPTFACPTCGGSLSEVK